MPAPTTREGTGRLSVVVPAWNEEDGIAHALEALLGEGVALVADGWVGSVEVVVVDDGSSDRTPAILAAAAAADDRLLVVTHPRNRGLGAAIRSGIDAATGELVLYTDADLPFDVSEIRRALALCSDDRPVVAMYRRSRRGEGPRRFVYSIVYNLLVTVLLDVRVRDVNFAGKLFPREIVAALGLRSEGSFIDAELVARLRRAGTGIAQMPVEYRPRSRGVSTLSSASVVRGMLRELRELGPGIRRGTGGRA